MFPGLSLFLRRVWRVSNTRCEFHCGLDNSCDDILASVILLSTFQDFGQYIRVGGLRTKEMHSVFEARHLLLLGCDGGQTDNERLSGEVLVLMAPAVVLLQASQSQHCRLQRVDVTNHHAISCGR